MCTNIVKGIWSTVCYLKDYESNIEKFKTMYDSLKSAGEGLQRLLEEAKRLGGLIPIDVEPWLRRMEAINEEVRVFLEKEARLNTGCLCANLKSFYSLSKQAIEMTKVLAQLQDEYLKLKEKFSRVSVDALKSKATDLVAMELEKLDAEKAVKVVKEVDIKKIRERGLEQAGMLATDHKVTVSSSIAKLNFK